nr:hypothetical protein [uncultured Holophaga sp.]
MRAARWLCPLFALALGAQDADPKYMGIQARVSYPVGDLKSASGPVGAGLGLFVEQQIEGGYAVRLAGGADMWGKGLSGGLSGEDRARLYHFDVEGLVFLRPDEEANLLGPYLVGGVGAYGWELVSAGQTTRTLRWGGTLGFGYRLSPRVDAEIRALYSQARQATSTDPSTAFNAMALTGGLNLRF